MSAASNGLSREFAKIALAAIVGCVVASAEWPGTAAAKGQCHDGSIPIGPFCVPGKMIARPEESNAGVSATILKLKLGPDIVPNNTVWSNPAGWHDEIVFGIERNPQREFNKATESGNVLDRILALGATSPAPSKLDGYVLQTVSLLSKEIYILSADRQTWFECDEVQTQNFIHAESCTLRVFCEDFVSVEVIFDRILLDKEPDILRNVREILARWRTQERG